MFTKEEIRMLSLILTRVGVNPIEALWINDLIKRLMAAAIDWKSEVADE